MHPLTVRISLCLALIAGCADGLRDGTCTRTSDCPAGQVCSDGRCLPGLPDGGTWMPDAAAPDPDPDLYVFPDGTEDDGPRCVPNLNGAVERDEVLFAVPSLVATTVSNSVTVDLAGTVVGGLRHWDLSGLPAQGSGTVEVAPVPAWAAADFPQATYASELMADYGVFSKVKLLGVFRATPSALQLIGLVSDSDGHTKLKYDRPLDMLRFPVAHSDDYASDAHASGYTDLFPYVSYDERYAIDVLGTGKLKLIPGLTLDALLVRVRQSVYQAWNPFLGQVSTTAFLFVAECYGTVARIIADTDPGDTLDQVAVEEMWRLAAP